MYPRARYLLPALLLPILGGCLAGARAPADRSADCADVVELERVAAQAEIFVSVPRAVPAYPALATDRVLAGFDPLTRSARERRDWLQRLQDAGALRRELLRTALAQRGIEMPAAGPARGCLPPGLRTPDGDTSDWQQLASAVQVGDDYLGLQRVLGLYPLTALPVGVGVRDLQRDITQTFATPLADLPQVGVLQRYVPLAPLPEAPGSLAPAARDALGVRPAGLRGEQLDRLFDRHAPILEIDVGADYDRPGAPFFAASGEVSVDITTPRAYRYARVMPLGGELRLQLVYVFWFAERPRRDAFDMLGGRLDGLVWRVTVDGEGESIVYDAIHPCGCYHMLFPSSRLALRSGARERPEPPLIPQAAPRPAAGERVVLRLQSATHYLQRVYTSAADADARVPVRRYVQRPYGDLYSVPSARGVRSLFGAAGIVPGTQRGERFYLWPMGVRSPGAMRERGRQATAFLGRRHFDDAQLLEDIFELLP